MFQDSSKSPGTRNGARVFAGTKKQPYLSHLNGHFRPTFLELLMSLSFRGRKTQSEGTSGGSPTWPYVRQRRRRLLALLSIRHRSIGGPPARASREEEEEAGASNATVWENCSWMTQQRVLPSYRVVPRRCLCVMEQKPLTQTPPPRPPPPSYTPRV